MSVLAITQRCQALYTCPVWLQYKSHLFSGDDSHAELSQVSTLPGHNLVLECNVFAVKQLLFAL